MWLMGTEGNLPARGSIHSPAAGAGAAQPPQGPTPASRDALSAAPQPAAKAPDTATPMQGVQPAGQVPGFRPPQPSLQPAATFFGVPRGAAAGELPRVAKVITMPSNSVTLGLAVNILVALDAVPAFLSWPNLCMGSCGPNMFQY